MGQEIETVTRQITVRGKNGMHARPADLFARQAARFQCKIEVVKQGVRVDAKSILDVLTLAAEQGTVLTLEAAGPDAQEALEALAKLVEVDLAGDDMIDH
jgi:phosphotransferase system HPr (HPr) family protein